MSGWIGVDLDGTLAHYNGWNGGAIGHPLKPMVDRVKGWLALGREVRIVTARVSSEAEREEQARLIQDWCEEHLGQRLTVTCSKDFEMIELWDDRAVQVITNIGVPIAVRNTHQ